MFSLEFKMDNAAFGDNEAEALAEAADILRKLADRVEGGSAQDGGKVMDANGNSIGSWSVDWEASDSEEYEDDEY